LEAHSHILRVNPQQETNKKIQGPGMTVQIREVLFYKGCIYQIATEPLSQLLDIMGDERPVLMAPHTACWRGYTGTWQIKDNKLFLIDFKGYDKNHKKVGIDYIFPDQKKIFAGWYTGEIIIQTGRMLHYEHAGYMSVYEKDLFLKFEKGILVGSREVNNR